MTFFIRPYQKYDLFFRSGSKFLGLKNSKFANLDQMTRFTFFPLYSMSNRAYERIKQIYDILPLIAFD